jgi:uncharacterized protein DUF3800
MLVFIDESGDAGFKIDKGSSRYFVLAAVIFDDELIAEKTAVDIKLLRRELKLSDNYEFHFNGSKRVIKEAFLKKVSINNFRARVLVVDKTQITSVELKNNRASFYNYAVKLLLKDAQGKIEDAKIKLDGRGDRTYKRAAGSYLRSQLNRSNSRIIKSLHFVDSKENVLIQLADMISGAVYHASQNLTETEYQSLIRERIENIWRFK